MSTHSQAVATPGPPPRLPTAVIFAVTLTGLIGVFELTIAFGLSVINLDQFADWFFHTVLQTIFESPQSPISLYIVHTVPPVTAIQSAKANTLLWLSVHGLTNFALAYAVLRRQLWVYPVAITAFLALTLYQSYVYVRTPNLILAFLVVIGFTVILLTGNEFRREVTRLRLYPTWYTNDTIH